MKTVVSRLPESRTSAARRCPSARVKPVSIRNASVSPVMRVAVLFFEPTGKSRSMTLKSRLLMIMSFLWSVRHRGEGGQAGVDGVGVGVTDGEDRDAGAVVCQEGRVGTHAEGTRA